MVSESDKTNNTSSGPSGAPQSSSVLSSDSDFKKKKPEKDYEEHVVGHLKELRNRIIIAGAALIIGAIAFYPFSGDAIAYLWSELIPESVIMSIYSPTEYLMTQIKLSVAFAICIFFPLLMYELFKFMSRGLYKNERRFLLKVVPVSFILFLLGAALAYFIILPLFLNYVLFYSDQTAVAQIGLGETFGTIISLVLGFGLVFQIPLLMVSVVRMGIVDEKTVRKGRLVIYGSLVGFAFLVAPDPTLISQLIAGVALIILFEFSLILLKIL
jgi:Twin arginine targeting (Tat) protein translocase TatC